MNVQVRPQVLSSGRHDCLSGSIRAALLLCLAASASSQDSPTLASGLEKSARPEAERAERLPLHLEGALGDIAGYEQQVLEVPASVDETFTLETSFEGRAMTLVLDKHSVRAAGYQIREQREDGSYALVDPGPVLTFRGGVLEEKGALVTGALLDTGLEANILLPDGRTLGILPDLDAFAAGDRSTYLIFDQRDVVAQSGSGCNTTPIQDPSSTPGTSSAGGCNGLCRAELALDIDYMFFQRYGSSIVAASAAENIVNWMNVVFERDVEIRHDLTQIIVRTSLASEPAGYNTSDTTALLGAMKIEWLTNQQGVVRDVAHLLSGRLAGGEASLPLGAICDSNAAYSVSGTQQHLLAFDANLMTHELGHNWGAFHLCCPFANCSGCSSCSEYYTMNPCFPPLPGRFKASPTVTDIVAHKASRTCLEPVVFNDNFEDAQAICPGDLQFTFTTLATNDGSASCGSSSSTPDTWYVYTPASNGTMTVDTCNVLTSYDTALSVHASNGFTLAEVGCNDDACGSAGLQSQLTLGVVAGRSYWIRVSGWNGSTGLAGVQLSGPPCEAPFNDSWRDALDIGPGDYHGTTASATADGSPSCAVSSPDVWFTYRPRDVVGPPHGLDDEIAVLDLCASSFDTVLSVHDADHAAPNSAAAVVVCNDNSCGNRSRVEWIPASGKTYLIRVGGAGATGAFRLGLSGPDSENERSPGTPVELGVTYIAMEGVYGIAGSSSCAPLSTPLFSRWYSYTAPVAGTLSVTTCGTNDWTGTDIGNDTVVSLHIPSGLEIACSDDSVWCAEPGVARDSFLTTTVLAGTQTLIRIQPAIPLRGRQPVELHLALTPDNDFCSAAQEFPSSVSTLIGTLDGATTDGSADCGSSTSSPDVWYAVTAPGTGTLRFTTCGSQTLSGVDTVLSIHDDCVGTIGNQLECNDDTTTCGAGGTNLDSAVSIPASVGQPYWLRVSNYSDGPTGNFLLNREFVPDNDACAGALPVANGQVPGTLLGATPDGSSSCDPAGSLRDVWYRYVATCDGLMTVDTCGSSMSGKAGLDLLLSVHSACVGTVLNELGCSDNDCGTANLDPRVVVNVTAGQPYWIRVAATAQRAFDLNVTCTAPPANNLCADAIPVGNGTTQGSTLNATAEGSFSCGPVGAPEVWYRYTATCSGVLSVSTCGTHDMSGVDLGTDSVLSLHSACGGIELACNDDAPGSCGAADQGSLRDSFVTLSVVAGQEIRIAVGSYNPQNPGSFLLNIACVPHTPPANDSCVAGEAVGEGSFLRSLLGATPDGQSNCDGGGLPDAWFRYTASCTGLAQIHTCGTNDFGGVDQGLDTLLSVHAACPGTGANSLACANDVNACVGSDLGTVRDTYVTFQAVAGTTYLVRVAALNATATGIYRLVIQPCTPSEPGTALCFCTQAAGPPCNNPDSSAGCRNSTGAGSRLNGTGTASVSANDAVVTANQLPANQPGIIFGSTGSTTLPFGAGLLCGAGGTLVRYPVQGAGAGGVMTQANLASLGGFGASQTVRFQAWYRDPQGPCSSYNLSNAYQITFAP